MAPRAVRRLSVLITAATLRDRTAKDLAVMAKKQGVTGWHAMRKDQLVKALLRSARARAAQSKPLSKSLSKAPSRKSSSKQTKSRVRRGPSTAAESSSAKSSSGRKASAPAAAPKPTQSPLVRKRLEAVRNKLADIKNLATANGSAAKEGLVLLVRDPYWLHLHWQIAPRSVQRAKAAMSHLWHTAKPTLRLFEVSEPGATRSETRMVREIEVHGGVNDWYLDVNDPPKTYCAELGYLGTDGSFHRLARSNSVTTPATRGGNSFERHWEDEENQFDQVYAMSGGDRRDATEVQELLEQRLGRPMGSPMVTRFGSGAKGLLGRNGKFDFDVDLELIVYGSAQADAFVTVKGIPVALCPDGTFSMRFNLPNKRHVIPVVANSCDGVEQRTILLAVERNTKVMDPVVRESTG